LTEKDSQAEYPSLTMALAAAWPMLGRWQSRLDNDRRIQAIRDVLQRSAVQRALRVGIVGIFVIFFGLTVYRNWAELQTYDWQADLRYILYAGLGYPLAYVPTIWCWHRIIGRVGCFWDVRINTHIFSLTSLGRYVPGAIWHIAGRAYWYQEQGIPGSQVVIGSAWETIVFVASGLLMYTLVGWRQMHLFSLGTILLAILLPVALGRLIAITWRRLGLVPPSTMRPLDILILYGLLGLAWAFGGLLLWWVTNAIYPLEVSALPSVIGIWGLTGAIGIVAGFLVGGLGIRELTLSALLSQLIPLPVAIVVALAFRLVLTASEGIWALTISWLTRSRGRIAQKD
jgi:hypothetical protein